MRFGKKHRHRTTMVRGKGNGSTHSPRRCGRQSAGMKVHASRKTKGHDGKAAVSQWVLLEGTCRVR